VTRRLLPILVLSLLAISCGGNDSSETRDYLYLVSGKVAASDIKGLKVCVAETAECTVTGDDGSFKLESSVKLPRLEFFLNGENGEVKLGDYQLHEEGEVITPEKITGTSEAGETLARLIHSFNDDTTMTKLQIDLSKVTIQTPLSTSIEELIKSNTNFTIDFSYNGTDYYVSYDSSNDTLELCQDTNGCQEVTYERKWLILIYMNGDNDLDVFADYDISELSKVQYPPTVKVVVLRDFFSSLGYTVYASNEVTGEFEELTTQQEELNMGDSQTLINFVEEFMSKYPSEKTALILWNHGEGWRGPSSTTSPRIASVDEGNNDYLFMYELKEALEELKKTGYNLDLIGFDECLMGGIEVLADIKDYADAFVVSETYEPGAGWNYERIMEKLIENPDADAYTLGKYIVDSYGEEYNSYPYPLSLAVFNREEVENLLDDLDKIALTLNEDTFYLIQEAREKSTIVDSEDAPDYVDLYSFALQLEEKGIVPEVVQNIKEIIDNAYKSLINTTLKGIYIYFPENPSDYSCCYGYEAPSYCSELGINNYYNPFAEISNWDEMLEDYYGYLQESN